MIPKEIFDRVRLIEIHTRSVVNSLFAGEYHSVFKGRGMEFAEVREYQQGDDVRSIDWNVTARAGRPFVKLFDEERELTVLLVVDASASGAFGSTDKMKGEVGVEISALLAFSAIKNNDRVGLLIFTDEVEVFLPPKKGRRHVLRVIRELALLRTSGAAHLAGHGSGIPRSRGSPPRSDVHHFRLPRQRVRDGPAAFEPKSRHHSGQPFRSPRGGVARRRHARLARRRNGRPVARRQRRSPACANCFRPGRPKPPTQCGNGCSEVSGSTRFASIPPLPT